MSERREGDEMAEMAAWRAVERAEAYLTVRAQFARQTALQSASQTARARGASTRSHFGQIGGRSSLLMNSPG
jgi:hypothetical protein